VAGRNPSELAAELAMIKQNLSCKTIFRELMDSSEDPVTQANYFFKDDPIKQEAFAHLIAFGKTEVGQCLPFERLLDLVMIPESGPEQFIGTAPASTSRFVVAHSCDPTPMRPRPGSYQH